MAHEVKRMGILAFSALIALAVAQPDAQARKLVPVETDLAPATGLVVTVRDDNGALAGAAVLVETEDGKLLANGATDSAGHYTAAVTDAQLAAGVNVTAAGAGHSAVSFLSDLAHRVTLELPLNPVDSYVEMSGRLTGFKDSDDDTKAQAGLVAKALQIDDLASLDTTSIISPLNDQIELAGTRNIPSNVVLPDQTFPVYFIPVHLEKPTYRLPLLAGTSLRYFGVTGAINVQDAVNALQGNNGWAIINALTFQKVALTGPVPAVAGNKIAFDFSTDVEIRDTMTLHPGKNMTSGDSHRLVAAIWEPEPGLFVPTDIKLATENDVTLTAVEAAHAKVLDIVVGSGGRFRGAWLAQGSAALPDSGLTVDLALDKGLNDTWLVSGGENAQLMVAHVEEHLKNSVGAGQFVDRWVLVGPRRAPLRLPPAARAVLADQLGKISHVSLDLLQTGHGSYPFISGESASRDLSSLEQVRKALQ